MSEQVLSIKLVLIGNSGVGKTAILSRLVNNAFASSSTCTIGVEHRSYHLDTDLGSASLAIWDTAGQERYRSVSRAYFRNALGAFLVYAIDDESSFNDLDGWLGDLRSLASPNSVVFLIGNKSDLEDDRVITRSQAEDYAQRNSLYFCETSARYGDQISEGFAELTRQIQGKVRNGDLPALYQAAEPRPTSGKTAGAEEKTAESGGCGC
jgi:small GTP-binding protein